MNTRHSGQRAQQRSIPPFIDQALDLYGEERYNGYRLVIFYFDKSNLR